MVARDDRYTYSLRPCLVLLRPLPALLVRCVYVVRQGLRVERRRRGAQLRTSYNYDATRLCVYVLVRGVGGVLRADALRARSVLCWLLGAAAAAVACVCFLHSISISYKHIGPLQCDNIFAYIAAAAAAATLLNNIKSSYQSISQSLINHHIAQAHITHITHIYSCCSAHQHMLTGAARITTQTDSASRLTTQERAQDKRNNFSRRGMRRRDVSCRLLCGLC